jgi:GT2 family glycosyltransferase
MTRVPIGVVVVNWNGYADTVVCLESLLAAEPGPARIVVVDNASTDGSSAALARWMERAAGTAGPALTYLSSETNRGFAGANNLGIASLGGDRRIEHFLLLNNDATAQADFFAELGRVLTAAPDAAIVGTTIYEAGASGRVWYAGGAFVPLRALAVHLHEVPQDQTAVSTAFVTGCAMLVSRRAWDVLGPLPECYFMYMEDAEYSHRAGAAGLRVLYAPRAVAHHAVGAAVGRAVQPPQLARWVTRSRALFVRRNLRGWRRWGALVYLIVTKPGRALAETLAGRPALGRAILSGTLEGLLSEDGDPQVRQAPTGQRAEHRVGADQ